VSAPRVLVVSLALALLINALVAVGAAVAAIDTAPADLAPAEITVVGKRELSAADVAVIAQQVGALP
jgi:hypothetical protein